MVDFLAFLRISWWFWQIEATHWTTCLPAQIICQILVYIFDNLLCRLIDSEVMINFSCLIIIFKYTLCVHCTFENTFFPFKVLLQILLVYGYYWTSIHCYFLVISISFSFLFLFLIQRRNNLGLSSWIRTQKILFFLY